MKPRRIGRLSIALMFDRIASAVNGLLRRHGLGRLLSAPGRRRRLTLAGIVALGALVLVLAVPGIVWQVGMPELGLSAEARASGAVVVTGVRPGGSGAEAGVRAGDVLLAVGDVVMPPATSGETGISLFARRIYNEYRAGDRVEWTVERAGERRTMVGTLSASREHLVSNLVVFGVFWLMGWFLLWARPDVKHVRHLVLAILASTCSVALWPNSAMAVDTPLGLALNEVVALGLFLAPATIVHFGIVFPRPTLSRRVRRRVLAATYGLFFVSDFVVHQAAIVGALRSPGAPYAVVPAPVASLHYGMAEWWLHVLDFGAAGAFMLWNYLHLEEDRLRSQVKWVLLGLLLTAGIDALAVGVALYSDVLTTADLFPFRTYLYLLIPAGLLIGVFRHDLFDVDRLLRGSAVYFATAATLFVLFAVTEGLVSNAVQRVLPAGSGTVGTASAAVLAAALFQPLRKWIRRAVFRFLPVEPERVAAAE